MTTTEKHIAKVLKHLNGNVEYALLRNFEGLPYNNSSRDIDIIITAKEFSLKKQGIVDALIEDGWQIFSYLNNGRLITYVCSKLESDELSIVQWDFFLNTSVHGIELISAEEMVESREFNGELYHVSKEYEFLDKYLYNRAVGAQYPEKYAQTRQLVEQSEMVSQKVGALFGNSDLNVVDKMSSKRLLLAVFKYNFRKNPFVAGYSLISSLLIYLVSFLRSNVAPTLAFTGADGAGKTTVIGLIEEKLSPVYGKCTEYFHFRPLLIPNLGEAAHSAGIKKEVDREYDKPHRGKNQGGVISFIRLCYYTLDYVFGYWLKIKSHCKITKVVIFDRYYSDVIVDSRRSSIYLPIKFLYFWGKLFVPKMRYNFLVTADADVILSRKQELDRDGIDSINGKMEYLAGKNGYYLIKNNGTAEACVMNILGIILNEQHKRNLKRI